VYRVVWCSTCVRVFIQINSIPTDSCQEGKKKEGEENILVKFPVNQPCAVEFIDALGFANRGGFVHELEINLFHAVCEIGVVVDVDPGAQISLSV
jgi:hypothetical protein